MNWFLNIILIILAAIIQTTVMHFLSFKLGIANLIFDIFIILIFMRYFRLSLVWAILGGLALDLLSPLPPGTFTIGFLLIYGLLYLFFKPLELNEFLGLLVIVFLATIVFDFLIFGYYNLFGGHLPIKSFFNIIIFDSLLNIILCSIIYPFMIYLSRRLFSRSQKIISLVEMYK
jgi:rod shape-determining protein MreD